MRAIWISILLTAALSLNAAEVYIRSGESGTGASWSDALDDLPATLVAGNTYWMADGSYAARAFPEDGTSGSRITIKKAIVADHGTSTGWLDTYGDGSATFTGQASSHVWAITGDYITFDGQVGEKGVTAFGFILDYGDGERGIGADGGIGVTIRYTKVDGVTETGDYFFVAGTKGIGMYNGTRDFTFSHGWIRGNDSNIEEPGSSVGQTVHETFNTIIEHSLLEDTNSSNPAFHANIYFATASTNGTFRYNRVRNYTAEGFFFTGFAQSPAGWKIYGNMFYNGNAAARGVELRQDYNYTNILMYNNTFVELGSGGILNRTPETGNTTTGCEAINNLSYDAPNLALSSLSVNSNNTADTTDRFADLGDADFHLTAHLAGADLPSPYNVDPDGVIRGYNGTFDRGAFQFVTEDPPVTASGVITQGAPIFQGAAIVK